MPATVPSSDVDRHYYRVMTWSLAGLVLILLSAFLVSGENTQLYNKENGMVEILSAAGYVTVIVALCREAGGAFVRRHAYFLLIPLAMLLRELDFHTRFTTINMTKSSFYVSAEVPLVETLLADLRAGRAYAVSLALAGFLTVGSKLIDGLARKLGGFGIVLSEHGQYAGDIFEEVMELGIPLFFLIAVFAYFSMEAGAARRPAES
jgi:hypothetical protein